MRLLNLILMNSEQIRKFAETCGLNKRESKKFYQSLLRTLKDNKSLEKLDRESLINLGYELLDNYTLGNK